MNEIRDAINRMVEDAKKKAKPKQKINVERHNAELHKTSAFLADEARRAERAMDRGRWRR
jgi:hypothetical protein